MKRIPAQLEKALKAQDSERRRYQQREVMRDFVEGARTVDAERFLRAVEVIEGDWLAGGWRACMRAIAKVDVPDEFRMGFLGPWLVKGDHIRGEVGNDAILCEALRALLPRYAGPARTLFRGDGAWNRQHRAYGLCWTASLEVARGYAEKGLWRTTRGGSVVLAATAPTEAIISAPWMIDDRYAEQEYVVDRRRLTSVKVIERYSEASPFPRSS